MALPGYGVVGRWVVGYLAVGEYTGAHVGRHAHDKRGHKHREKHIESCPRKRGHAHSTNCMSVTANWKI